MKLVQLQVIDTDKGTNQSLIVQLPDKSYIDLITLNLIEEDFEKLLKSFIEAAKLTCEMEGDCNE